MVVARSGGRSARGLRYGLGVLVNRLLEAARSSGHVHRELARRARDAVRRPIVVVPPVLGVRLVDDRGRTMWGATPRLLFTAGQTLGPLADARPDGHLAGFTLVPRLYERDVLGGLVRYLERIYGAREGEDLFVLAYDWRRPLAEGARELARLLARIRGASDAQVDLIGISSGGNVIRSFLAGDPDEDLVLGPAIGAIHRVVYLGTPHRGNVGGFGYLVEGIQIFGVRPDGPTLQRRCPSIFDLLPHPDERIFVDAHGDRLELDHLDPRTWRELRLPGHDRPELAADLARARAEHLRVARVPHPPSVVIADRHRPTAARAVILDGALVIPCASCKGDPERYPYAFEPGDGVVPAATMAAAPGLSADGPWWVNTSEHARIATDAHVHPLVVEALLSPHKPVPRERYLWPRNPNLRGVVPPEDPEAPEDNAPRPLSRPSDETAR